MRDIDIHWRGYPHHLPKVRFVRRRKPAEPISLTDGAGSSKGKDKSAKTASKLRPVADIPVYWRSRRPSFNSDRISISSAREPIAVVPTANPVSSEQDYHSTAPEHTTVRTYDPRIAPASSSKFARPIKSAATQLGPFKPNVTRYYDNRGGRTSGKSSRQSLRSISRLSAKSRSRRSATPSVHSIIKSVLSEAPSRTPSQRKALDQFTKDLASYSQKVQRSPKQPLVTSPTVTTISAHTIRELKPYQAQFKSAGLAVTSGDQRGMPKSSKIAIRATLPGRDDIRYRQSRDSRFRSNEALHKGTKSVKPTKRPKEPSYASGSTGTTVIGFTPPHEKSYPRAHRPRKASSLSSDHTIVGFTPPHERFTTKRNTLPSTPVVIEVISPQKGDSSLPQQPVIQSGRVVAGISDLREDGFVLQSPRQGDRAIIEGTRPQQRYSPQPQPAVVQSDYVIFEPTSPRERVVIQPPLQSDRAVVGVTHPQDNYSPKTPFTQSDRVAAGRIDLHERFASQGPLQSGRAAVGTTRPQELYYGQATAIQSEQGIFDLADSRDGYVPQASFQIGFPTVGTNVSATNPKDMYVQGQYHPPDQDTRAGLADSGGRSASQTPVQNILRTVEPTAEIECIQERHVQNSYPIRRRNTVVGVAPSQERFAQERRALVGNRPLVGVTPPREISRQELRPFSSQGPVVGLARPEEIFVHKGYPLPREPPNSNFTAPHQIARAALTHEPRLLPGPDSNGAVNSQEKLVQEGYAPQSSNEATRTTITPERAALGLTHLSGQDSNFGLAFSKERLVQGLHHISGKEAIGAFTELPDRATQELPPLHDDDPRGTKSQQGSPQEVNPLLVTESTGGATGMRARFAQNLPSLPHHDETAGTRYQEKITRNIYQLPRGDNVQSIGLRKDLLQDTYPLRNADPIGDTRGLQDKLAQEKPTLSNDNKVQVTHSQEMLTRDVYPLPRSNNIQGAFSQERFVQEAHPLQSAKPITVTTGPRRRLGQQLPIPRGDNVQLKISQEGLTPPLPLPHDDFSRVSYSQKELIPQHPHSNSDSARVKHVQEGPRPLRPVHQRNHLPVTDFHEDFAILQNFPIGGDIRMPPSQGLAPLPSIPRGDARRSQAALPTEPPLPRSDDGQANNFHKGLAPAQFLAQKNIAPTPPDRPRDEIGVKQSQGITPILPRPANISENGVKIACHQAGLHSLPSPFPFPNSDAIPVTLYQEAPKVQRPHAPVLGGDNIQMCCPQEGLAPLSLQAPTHFGDNIQGMHSREGLTLLQPQSRVLWEDRMQTTRSQEEIASLTPPPSQAPLAPILLVDDIRATRSREGLAPLQAQAPILRGVDTQITCPYEGFAPLHPLLSQTTLPPDSFTDSIQVTPSQEGLAPLEPQAPAVRDDFRVIHLQGLTPLPIQAARAPLQFSDNSSVTRAQEGLAPLRAAIQKPTARECLPWLRRSVAYAEMTPIPKKDRDILENREYPPPASLGGWAPNFEEEEILTRPVLQEEHLVRNSATVRLENEQQGLREKPVETLIADAEPIQNTNLFKGDDTHRTQPSRTTPQLGTSIPAAKDRSQMRWSREEVVVTDANGTVGVQVDAMISPSRQPLPWLRNKRTSYDPEPQIAAIEDAQNKPKLDSLPATEADDDTSQALQLYHICTARSMRCQQCYPSPEASPVLKPVTIKEDPRYEKRRQDNNIFDLLQPEFAALPSMAQPPDTEEGTSNFDRKVFQGLHVATAAASDEDIDTWIEEATGVSIRKFLADLSVFEGLGINTLANIAKRASRDRKTNIKTWEAAREKRMSEMGEAARNKTWRGRVNAQLSREQ